MMTYDNELVVIVPASATALCTVQQARSHITGIDQSDTAATTALKDAIETASARIARELGYIVGRTTYDYTVYGYDYRTIRNASSFSMRRIVLPAPVDPDVLSVVGPDGAVTFKANAGALVNVAAFEIPQFLRIRFSAGWVASPTVVLAPPDLRHACVELVAQLWLQRGRSPDVAGESLGGVASVNYEPQRMPMSVLDVLDGYRRRTL